MPYRWTKETIDDNTLVESRQVDIVYSNNTAVINGGFDRDNLPPKSITKTSVADQALGRAVVLDNVNLSSGEQVLDTNYGVPASANNNRGNVITGWSYGYTPVNEGGFFIPVASQTITCEEGMLNVQWKCHTYMPQYWSYYYNFSPTDLVAHKKFQWEVRVNGVIVYQTPDIVQPFFTSNISTMVPISKGTQTVDVFIKLPNRMNDETNQVIMQYWGGQLYSHCFYR